MTDIRLDIEEASHYQRMAADPRATRLASANAGSGKTKVLVERVSRLLLGGADPDKILCLTYTKAAASEMQTRLFDTLGLWSVMDDRDLNAALDQLLGENTKRADDRLGQARQLFARALETPDGLKVQTIHAFCERVLSRFPIEAGIMPGFEPMEDADSALLRAQTEEDIYAAAYVDSDSDLAVALRLLAREKADMSLDVLFRWMASSGDAIKNWEKGGGISGLAGLLGIDMSTSLEHLYINTWNHEIRDIIKSAATSLRQSANANDQTKANLILGAITEPDLAGAFETYSNIFLTQKGTLRKSVVTLSAPDDAQTFFGTSKLAATPEAQRVLKVCEDLLSITCLDMTRAVYILAQDYARRYEQAKRARRWLDFNDQVLLVRNLLMRSEVAEWVRYKLDGGIGHILVDEAQDTAPDQWQIIDALKDGFTAPDPDWPHDQVKTFFAVGDEKQSIYSFQGARPEKFIEKIRMYVSEDKAASIRMRMSFRSAPDVLRVVDGVFNDQRGMTRMFDPETVDIASDSVTHSAFRCDRGLVELWPLAPRPDAPPQEKAWDTRPVDAPSQSSPRERLAVEIAQQIKTWLDQGEPIFDRNLKVTRAMQPEDILILVRRRNDFFDAVIRNMKMIGVPVAGADRLVLKESVAVKDMLALTRFVLLPQDDLSLAEVLKSPIIGFDEDMLFDVAKRREGQSLWAALQSSELGQARCAAENLSIICKYARQYAPYEFYARVLDMRFGLEASVLKKMYTRLGIEAKDALEAFLARALSHQRRGAPSLQLFLQSFIGDSQDIKREMDSGSGDVRVMTVHGAKGLEAPVVFLPDTTQTPTSRSGSGIVSVENGFAYIPSKDATPTALIPMRDAVFAREKEEYMRLLYVAMTRAESRLIVCGFESGHPNGKGYSDGSWYQEVHTAMIGLGAVEGEPRFDVGPMLRYGIDPQNPDKGVQCEAGKTVRVPDWAHDAAPRQSLRRRQVTPSHLLVPLPGAGAPVRSPISGGPDRFRRGNIIHKLLETLPSLEPKIRKSAAGAFLESYQHVSQDDRDQIIKEVFAVIDHPDYAAIFGPGSQAEVSLAGRGGRLPKGLYLNAQIDRLAMTDDKVFIVDYKSNRPPPQTQEAVADLYWGQMAAYRELAREIYPGREVICGLLWTDVPRMMILDAKRLDHALTLIAGLPT